MTWPKILLALLAAAAGWFGVQALTSGDSAPRSDIQAGDCLTVSGSLDAPDVEESGCSDGRANAVVTEVASRDVVAPGGMAAFCDPMEDHLFLKDDAPSLPAGFCLRMNASAGECWVLSDSAFANRAACTAEGDIVVRVESVQAGVTDPGACSPQAWPLVLEKRAYLYCLEQVRVLPEFQQEQEQLQSSAPADL